jgi:hypothetical protein
MDNGLETTVRQLIGVLSCLWILGALVLSVVTVFRHPERARVCACNLLTVQVLIGVPVAMVLDSEFAAAWGLHPLRLVHPARETILVAVYIGTWAAHFGTMLALANSYAPPRPPTGKQPEC